MKKKVLALFTVAVLVIGCSMSALAADGAESSDTENTQTEEEKKITDITEVTAKLEDGTALIKAEVKAEVVTAAEEAAKEIVSSKATVLKVLDLKLPEGEKLDTVKGTPITIEVPGIEKGMKVTVLHFNSETNKWEEVKVTKVEDGKVTALFKSLSPVAIVTQAKSSKTGEETSPLGFICILALAGAALCTKKFALES